MAFDYSKLRGRIVECCGTNSAFARAMGMSCRSLSLKLNNKRFFTQKEMSNAAEILGIPKAELDEYFFASKVQ